MSEALESNIRLPNSLAREKRRLLQCGAVAFRERDSRKREVALVTSLDTGRWVIPKGWPRAGEYHAQAAAREAYEEAGVVGRVAVNPIGSFFYDKATGPDGSIPCEVVVHLLAVDLDYATWPEGGRRRRAWFTPADAAARVQEAGLRTILLGLEHVPERSPA